MICVVSFNRPYCGTFQASDGKNKILVGFREESAILDVEENLWQPGVPFAISMEASAVVNDLFDFTIVGGLGLVDGAIAAYDKIVRFDGQNLEWVEEGTLNVGRWDTVAIGFDADDFCQ